jgi:NAD+ kinase
MSAGVQVSSWAASLAAARALASQRQFSSGARSSHGSGGSSSGGLPNAANLFPHPTLRKAVKICSACSASASHADSHPHNRPGLVKGGTLQWEDTHGEELQLQRRAHLVCDGGGPKTAFIVKKSGSARTSAALRKIGAWLESKGIEVLVERRIAREFPHYRVFDPCRNDADFCITLGGDGTVLHLTSLFVADEPLPPVVAFAMGTLGFLTPYDVDDFENALSRVLGANEAPVFCTLRTRKCCEVFLGGQRQAVHHVLNECLVDRGASPAMVTLQVSADRHHITTVQADGLIISTPSGSTAYSMSAGGPMVAPSVAGTLITPIAPHSLSFRPLVVPESSEIVVQIPKHARSHARASFDGRHTMRLQRGSAIRCTTSKCALPMVSLGYLDRDWYEGISTKLRWNAAIRPTGPIEEPVPELSADLDPHDSCPLPDSLDDYDMAGDANGARPSGNGADSKYL